MENDTTFGQKIRTLRESHNLSQDDLADILQKQYGLKVNRPTISRWEKGKQNPTITPIKALANYFNTTIDLLNNNEPIIPLSAQKKLLIDAITNADDEQLAKISTIMRVVFGNGKANLE